MLLKKSGLGCHVGSTYAGAFGYADQTTSPETSLLCLSWMTSSHSPILVHALKQMMKTCENFAKSHNIVFNSSKTKLLCYNKDPETVIPPIYLNGEHVPVVEHENHLGNFLSTNIYDRNNISNVCDLYQRSILLISDFRVCDCITLDSLFNTY